MISDASKISIAMELIEQKIANCMRTRRKSKDENIENEYRKLLLDRDQIYKGNYDVINKIINEVGEDKND